MPDDTVRRCTGGALFSRLTPDQPQLTAAPCIIRAADYRVLLRCEDLLNEAEQAAAAIRHDADTQLAAALEEQKKYAAEELARQQTVLLLETRQHCREVTDALEADITGLIRHTLECILGELPAGLRLEANLSQSLAQMQPHSALTLIIHPSQRDVISRLTDSAAGAEIPADLTLETDSTLSPGDCLLRQGKRIIHATLDNQLAVLHSLFSR